MQTATAPAEAPVLYDVAGGVATITLNRPDKLNSFNPEMHARLRAAIEAARSDAGVRALLLTGRGRAFCAGQDLAALDMGAPGGDAGLFDTIEDDYNPLVRSLRALDLPVVCAVNGVAAGAGANLALACDIVLAARSATFIQAFCKIGLVPDSGGTYWLPHLAGTARAMGLALLGDKLSAEQAEQWGLIWRAVADEQLMDEARKLAAGLAESPTGALAKMKHAIHAAEHNSLDAQLDLERDLQGGLGASHDFREGVAAFIAKRKPAFKGR